jgi:hypothetical protein
VIALSSIDIVIVVSWFVVVRSSFNNVLLPLQVFGEDRIRAFGMAKFISAHLS